MENPAQFSGGAVPLRKGLLFGSDGARGADTCAGAAVDANVRVDGVDIALADGAHGALADASTARNAKVF